MTVDVITSSFEDYEIDDESRFFSLSHWNEREVRMRSPLLNAVLRKVCYVLNTVTTSNNFPIDHYNYPIGLCPRGHEAYCIYNQQGQTPINLCNARRELCPFEYYKFLAFLQRK